MRRTAAALALGTLLLSAACGGSDEPSGTTGGTATKPGATVKMPLLSFDPVDVTVKVGESVTWVNENGIAHTLEQGTYEVDKGTGLRTSEKSDGAFTLDVAKKGDTVSFTYPKAGTFTYFCTIHKGMNGSVTVE